MINIYYKIIIYYTVVLILVPGNAHNSTLYIANNTYINILQICVDTQNSHYHLFSPQYLPEPAICLTFVWDPNFNRTFRALVCKLWPAMQATANSSFLHFDPQNSAGF